MRKILFVCAVLVLLFCIGCDAAQPDTPPADERPFAQVYDDGLRRIDAGRLLRLPAEKEGYEYCFLEIELTNNDIKPIYYSSLLCLRAESRGTALETENAPAAIAAAKASFTDFDMLDGTVDSGSTARGFVFFEAPAGTDEFDISIAADYCLDEWLSFSCHIG